MEAATASAGGTARRRSRGVPERRLAWYMVSPSLVLIALVALYPIIYAIWLSLHQYSLIQAGVQRWAEPIVAFLRRVTGPAMVVERDLPLVRGDGWQRAAKAQQEGQHYVG